MLDGRELRKSKCKKGLMKNREPAGCWMDGIELRKSTLLVVLKENLGCTCRVSHWTLM